MFRRPIFLQIPSLFAVLSVIYFLLMNIAPHKIRKANGFTVMEMIIVIIIIGVLAALAFPSYRIQTLKIRNQEAVRVLMAVWEAQKDYFRENGVYFEGDASAINANLDITIPSLKNFNSLYAPANNMVGCSGADVQYIVRVTSNDLSYELKALEDGRIVCHPCLSAICQQMGFKADW